MAIKNIKNNRKKTGKKKQLQWAVLQFQEPNICVTLTEFFSKLIRFSIAGKNVDARYKLSYRKINDVISLGGKTVGGHPGLI